MDDFTFFHFSLDISSFHYNRRYGYQAIRRRAGRKYNWKKIKKKKKRERGRKKMVCLFQSAAY